MTMPVLALLLVLGPALASALHWRKVRAQDRRLASAPVVTLGLPRPGVSVRGTLLVMAALILGIGGLSWLGAELYLHHGADAGLWLLGLGVGPALYAVLVIGDREQRRAALGRLRLDGEALEIEAGGQRRRLLLGAPFTARRQLAAGGAASALFVVCQVEQGAEQLRVWYPAPRRHGLDAGRLFVGDPGVYLGRTGGLLMDRVLARATRVEP